MRSGPGHSQHCGQDCGQMWGGEMETGAGGEGAEELEEGCSLEDGA